MKHEVNNELAIPDLQRRLIVLGYQLGSEVEKGLFGEKTAAAVSSFKTSAGLGNDDVLDQVTWATIIDASMLLGDRVLYLHMPHFRGRDVGELQNALAAMGFSCLVDNIFGIETEQALRDYQNEMALKISGILDDETLKSLLRLKHVWEGKRGYVLEGRTPHYSRCASVLERASVCFYGNDEPTRALANRIANVARATTADSGVVSAGSLAGAPGKDMLMIGLDFATESQSKQTSDEQQMVQLDPANPSSFHEEFCQEIQEAFKNDNRLVLLCHTNPMIAESNDQTLEYLELASTILDALCSALDEQ